MESKANCYLVQSLCPKGHCELAVRAYGGLTE
jgi:hypothetical protein